MAKDASTGKGVPAVVASTGEATSLCGSAVSLGDQFYITGQPSHVHVRAFNKAPRAAFESECVGLPLTAVRVGDLNLRPGDAHQTAFPDARRCVLFATGPLPACARNHPPTPSPPPPSSPLPHIPKSYFSPFLPGPFAALFAFGDSTIDIGNNNDIAASPFKANFLPYGIDYIPANGRFTNGKSPMDYVAEFLGQPPVPKYDDSNATTSADHFSAGINFASAWSGVLTETNCMAGTLCLSLSFQVSQFLAMCSNYTAEEKATSLFIISSGGSDYYSYFANPTAINATEFVGRVIDGLAETLQTLYAAGARKFLVTEQYDIGCSPFFLASSNVSESNSQCLTLATPLVTAHNAALGRLLVELQARLVGAYFTRFRTQEYIYHITSNPGSIGLSNGFEACCGGGRFGAEIECRLPSATVCADRDQFVWWDGGHLTQAVYRDIAKRLVEGDSGLVAPYSLDAMALL